MRDRARWLKVVPWLLLSLAQGSGALASREEFEPGRVLVKFKPGRHARFLPGSGRAARFDRDPDLYRVELPSHVGVLEALTRYKNDDAILFAEPDYIVRAQAVPDDALWPAQWNAQAIHALEAWDVQTGASDVVVGIVDSGIDLSHPDLAGNLWTDPVDGSHGWDCTTRTPGGQDQSGHGTHVAGIVGAVSNNGIGVSGIDWSVRLMSLRFLDELGVGAVSSAVACLDRAISLKEAGVNLRVLNLSWGTPSQSVALKDAVDRAEAAGLLLVCAAGNAGENSDFAPLYPAAFPNRGIVSVGASDRVDELAGFSNFGPGTVDIAAPGEEIVSTFLPQEGDEYTSMSGTSMAAPHVAGVAAALFHRNPALAPAEARDVLLDPASTDPFQPGLALTTSGGRLNYFRALTNPLLLSPRLNGFPVLDRNYPNMLLPTGRGITFLYRPTDPDGDRLHSAFSNLGYEGFPATAAYRWVLSKLFPQPKILPYNFVAPPLRLPMTIAYVFSTFDGRGGSAMDRTLVSVGRATRPGLPANGSLSVAPRADTAGSSSFDVALAAVDPEGGPVAWEILYSGNWTQFRPDVTAQTLSLSPDFWGNRSLRVKAMMVDRELNVSYSNSVVVRVGTGSGEPPIARAAISSSYGYPPFATRISFDGSSDPDGTVSWYVYQCGADGVVYLTYDPSPKTCSYPAPGIYQIYAGVVDNRGNADGMYIPVHVIAPTEDAIAPRVSLSAPQASARLADPVRVSASASDNLGISSVCFFEGTRGLGCVYDPPYALSTRLGRGEHIVFARATDLAGNLADSGAVRFWVSGNTKPKLLAVE